MSKAPMKEEKRNVHLLVDPRAYKLAKIECAKIDMNLSEATEALWKAWSKGEVKIQKD